MEKIGKHLKKNLLLYITFLVGIIVISTIYILQDVAPFGKNSLLTIDFFHQYGPMLGEFYDRLKDGSNLVYSFSMGMGLPFIRNFLNYLSSPFNFIILLFSRDNIVMSYSLIIGLKAVCSGLSLVYFVSKKFNTKSLYFIPLGILYGFCAYFAAYYWNIMWLDGMIFLPLIVLGIEKIVDKNSKFLYIFSLAVILVANYFIGYMICIFSVIYFIAYLILQTKKFNLKHIFKKSFIFAYSSVLAGGLSAAFLLPLFLGLSSISATSDVWPTSQYYKFTFLEYLGNHFSGVGSTVLSSGISNAANISVGILSIALLLLFILNNRIKLKLKIVYTSILIFLVVSFFYAPLDYIWHAFHVPNDLPYRYSFLYSFILIVIGAYSINKIDGIKLKCASFVYTFLMLCITALYFFHYKNIDNSIILLNYTFLTLYFFMYILYNYFPNIKKLVAPVFIIAVAVETIITVNNNWNILQYLDDFYADYDTTKNALNFIENNDDSIYRIDRTSILSYNDPSWYGYYGQTTFSSMAYENLAVLQNNLGMPGNNINSYYYKQNTPVYDLMFNIKYFFGDSKDISRYSLYYNSEGNLVFKSRFNAGLMFAADKNIAFWNYNGDDPFKIQNDFVSKATGVDNVFEKMTLISSQKFSNDEKTMMKYTYKNPGDNMYFYTNNSDIDFIIVDQTIYYFDSNFDYFDSFEESIDVFDFKDFHESYVVSSRTENDTYTMYVGYNNYRYDSFSAYSIDNEEFEEAAYEIQNNKITITDFKENNITATITVDEDCAAYTSIPFDDGWKVFVNDQEVETYKVGNSLLAFDLTTGSNNITLKYFPKGFVIGSIISGSSLIVCIILFLPKRKKTKKKNPT